MKKIKIGLLGYGTIGKGVKEHIDLISNTYNCEIVKILDKPQNKDIVGSLYVSNFKDITLDNDIDIVIEAMGGNDFAYECIKSALLNKKSVITSNKEVVSNNLKEFNILAKENNVEFLFEASVGGGIPIIQSILDNTKFNEVNGIYGIINGTTNFILSSMEDGLSFEEALKLAQERGFAEADPTADLEGLDMVRKIAILSDIAYDTFIDTKDIYHYGIKNVTKEIIDYLRDNNLTIKFMASSTLSDGKIKIFVMPRILNNQNEASNVRYENNIIAFNANRNDKLSFVGKGAGSFPTASAIISDVIKVIEHTHKSDKNYNKIYEIDKNIISNDDMYFVVSNGKYKIVKGDKLKMIEDVEFFALVEE